MINPLILKQKAPVVFNDLLEALGDAPEDPNAEDPRILKILDMNEFLALCTYLTYNGIIGYTKDIIEALDAIRAAEVKP